MNNQIGFVNFWSAVPYARVSQAHTFEDYLCEIRHELVSSDTLDAITRWFGEPYTQYEIQEETAVCEPSNMTVDELLFGGDSR